MEYRKRILKKFGRRRPVLVAGGDIRFP